jgi:hypothetical protein
MNKNRYSQYLEERFKPSQFIFLSSIFGLLIYLVSTVYYRQGLNLFLAIIPVLALFLFLLRLRLFDEFKDHEHDLLYYPERPIPRGLFKLAELKKFIYITVALEFFISMSNVYALIFFTISLGYSVLMFKEFFCRQWLRQHFTIYILLHEILLLPLFVYLFVLSGWHPDQIGSSFLWWIIFCFSGQFFLLEVTRKFRAPAAEIQSRDTYTAQYGISGASGLIIFLGLFILICQFVFAQLLFHKFIWVNYLSASFFLVILLCLGIFIKSPSQRVAKKVFFSAIIFVLGTDALLILYILFLSR